MNSETLHKILHSVATGKTSVDEAAKALTHISFENINFAQIDHNRSLRKGFPEVVFGQGKTAEQIIRIVEKILKQEDIVLVTRVSQNKANKIKSHFPDIEYHEDAGMVIFKKKKIPIQGKGKILVLSAGTSDIPVAKEAYLTAENMGNQVEAVFVFVKEGIVDLGDIGVIQTSQHAGFDQDALSKDGIVRGLWTFEGHRAIEQSVGGQPDVAKAAFAADLPFETIPFPL